LFFFFSISNDFVSPDCIKHQNQSNKKKEIKQLSEGTLIVRLSKCESIIESIKIFEGEEKSRKEQDRIKQSNKNLMKEFLADYSFSDVVFAYEVDLHQYLQDEKRNVFLNSELEIDPNLKIKKEPFYILSSFNYRVFQLYNDEFELIDKSPKYFNGHYKRKYQFALARVFQSLSNIFVLRKTTSNFNRKLFSKL